MENKIKVRILTGFCTTQNCYLLWFTTNRISKIEIVQAVSYRCSYARNIILDKTWPHHLTYSALKFSW